MAEWDELRLYSCFKCRNHVARHDDIICKTFMSDNWTAFLFSNGMNIVLGPAEDRQLLTGLHKVADVFCYACRERLGWKYERAYEESQKFKEGKLVLERFKIIQEN